MAAGSWTWYHSSFLEILNQTQDYVADDHYMILLTSSHTPSQSDQTVSDLDNECADGDYSPQDCTGESISGGSGTVTYDLDDVDFGNAVSITAQYAVLCRGTAGAKGGTDKILCYSDLSGGAGDLSSVNDDFDITIDANGILQIALS